MARLAMNLGRIGDGGASECVIEVLFDLVGLGTRGPRLDALPLGRPAGSACLRLARRLAMPCLVTKTEDRVGAGRLGPASDSSVSLSTWVF
jgi:hypothetical protein